MMRIAEWGRRRGMAALLLVGLIAGWRPADDVGGTPGAVTDHVVIVSIDGLRPDAIERFGAKQLQRLMREGAYSLEAQTIFPSKTLPSHTSMLTSVPPEKHGVTWNSDETEEHGTVQVTTVFEAAKQAGLHTAAFFSKSKFRHLQKPGTLDYTQAPDGLGHMLATETAEDVVRYLRFKRPNLLFVHIGEPDYAGHTTGWMGPVYGWAVRRADAAVGEVLKAADRAFGRGNYTVLVTADHGGHGRDHGSADPRDMTIPWIAWGKGVQAGRLPAGIRTMDTAATALWLLGVPLPTGWTGTPVAAAFDPAARLAADSVAAMSRSREAASARARS
ncbi:MAG TPA: ectonucleotide pyrophosphatase/phosphodiesterase [Longimicrobiales bacterium]